MIIDPHAQEQEKKFSDTIQQGQISDLSDFDNQNLYSKKPIFSKLIFGLFLFLGIATLVFGFMNLSNNINNPFRLNDNSDNEQTQIDAWEKIVTLQNTDTDKDGLSDYDEEYIYGTSAYLADTDSDGFTDKQEVDSHNDPLCPAGINCLGVDTAEEADTEDLLQQETEPVSPASDTEMTEEMLQELQNLTPAEVRELLASSGSLTQEELNQINDEQLMQVFNEMISSQ